MAEHYSLNGSLRINDGEPAVGRTAITEAAQSFMTAFPDLQVKMDDLRMEGDQPEYHWTLLGKNTGPGGTGQQVRISGFEMWRMGEDGLIAKSQGHFDNADYQRQLAEETLGRGIQNDEESRVADEDLRRIGGRITN